MIRKTFILLQNLLIAIFGSVNCCTRDLIKSSSFEFKENYELSQCCMWLVDGCMDGCPG
jgi:hypothetical protein